MQSPALLAVVIALEGHLTKSNSPLADSQLSTGGVHTLMINVMHTVKGKERPLRQLLLSHNYPLVVFLQEIGPLPPSYSFHGIY